MKMRKLFFLFLIFPSYSFAEEIKLFNVNTNTMRLSCPCTFNESIKGAMEGSYGSGPQVFVIAPNEKQAHAIINLGNKDIKLLAKSVNRYICKTGQIYSSAWKKGDIELSATLKVTGPGAEACWFNGNVSVKVKGSKTSVPVKGACGC